MFSNKFNFKLLVKIIGVLISILVIVSITDSYLNSLTYKNPVNLKVAYTNYACENGNLFKVVAVDNNELKKYVGQDLSLLFKNKNLEDYTYNCISDSSKLASPLFQIKGYLHKYKSNFFLFDFDIVPNNYKLEVLDIKYIRD